MSSQIKIALLLTIIIATSCHKTIPDDWKEVKLYNMIDGRDYIIINRDNSFTLHEYIPNSEQTFEWKGKVENLKLITNKNLDYQGFNDFKPTEIDPQMKRITESIYGEHLQIDFISFNTIYGSSDTEKRRYSPKNVSPY